MTAYYNEHDPFAAQWLRELIKAGLIAPGIVDERSIEDVAPYELNSFTQCHFFAGIGVWSYALRRAGWGDDRPVWTGSCPCQPFSAAGKGDGFADERHLWPAFYHLISQCRPSKVFGEQVASKAVDDWIDLVHADMEAVGYSFGSVPFPSAGVGAPHIRDRNYWMADISSAGDGREQRRPEPSGRGASRRCGIGGVGESANEGLEGWSSTERCEQQPNGQTPSLCADGRPGPTNGLWRDADWLFCRDEKWRSVEPGAFPLAHGAAARVGRLRGYGNAINAEAAIAFIEASMK